mgnify:CR=1 FL=1|tara:strand:- start:16 stop:363 length:348 start_codon:yes stop_codon:yes gene_type:complete
MATTKGKKYDSATLINKDVDKRIDRGLKAAALDVEDKKNRALFKKIIGRRKSSAQDPSEVKKYKRKSLTPMVSKAYKKAQKDKKSRSVSDRDLDRGMLSKGAKARRDTKARGMIK